MASIVSAEVEAFSVRGLPITCKDAYKLVPQKIMPRAELSSDRSHPHPLLEYRAYEATKATTARLPGKNHSMGEIVDMAR